eukprot:scaffold22143_cov41-Cyclotella_meneghiniana.AAC.5
MIVVVDPEDMTSNLFDIWAMTAPTLSSLRSRERNVSYSQRAVIKHAWDRLLCPLYHGISRL